MSKKQSAKMRVKLFKLLMDQGSSPQEQREMLKHIASIPEEQREAEAEKINASMI